MMLYGLIGRKLGHSFSARFFNEKFSVENIPARYELFEIPSIQSLPGLLTSHQDLCGFNVTIPYKQDILPYLSSMTSTAREIGAVNTVRVIRCKEPVLSGINRILLEGHNTDAPGFRDALQPLLGDTNKDTKNKALILGTGGASKAVAFALKELGIPFIFVSRHSGENNLTYPQLDREIMQHCNIIINCTPLGMWPDIDDCPPIPYDLLDEHHLCFDLIYNPEMTEFMRRAQERGALVSNGLQMLHNQALLAWDFWQRPYKRRYMSRKVEVIQPDGLKKTYPLSIAEVSYGPEGFVEDVDILPFSEEMPGVLYCDSPLTIRLKDNPVTIRSKR